MVDIELYKINIKFFVNKNGKEPVRDWIRSLSKTDRAEIGEEILAVQYGWPIGMPLCRHVVSDIWEIRISLSSNKIVRILFCICRDHIILLHGFFKKSQKIPKMELNVAKCRFQELQGRLH